MMRENKFENAKKKQTKELPKIEVLTIFSKQVCLELRCLFVFLNFNCYFSRLLFIGNGQVLWLAQVLPVMFIFIRSIIIFSKLKCLAFFKPSSTSVIWHCLAQLSDLCAECLAILERGFLFAKFMLLLKLIDFSFLSSLFFISLFLS